MRKTFREDWRVREAAVPVPRRVRKTNKYLTDGVEGGGDSTRYHRHQQLIWQEKRIQHAQIDR